MDVGEEEEDDEEDGETTDDSDYLDEFIAYGEPFVLDHVEDLEEEI